MEPKTQKLFTLVTWFPATYTGAKSSMPIPIHEHLRISVQKLRPRPFGSQKGSESIRVNFQTAPDSRKVVLMCTSSQGLAIKIHADLLIAPLLDKRSRAIAQNEHQKNPSFMTSLSHGSSLSGHILLVSMSSFMVQIMSSHWRPGHDAKHISGEERMAF